MAGDSKGAREVNISEDYLIEVDSYQDEEPKFKLRKKDIEFAQNWARETNKKIAKKRKTERKRKERSVFQAFLRQK